jgi:LAO/AO transport system kinase
VSAADTVLVVLCPGAGDGVQAMKAGILEIGDVIVVNKSDLPGADRLALDLEEAVHVRTTNLAGRAACARRMIASGGASASDGSTPWTPPVVSCSAGKDEGIDAVAAAIEAHKKFLGASGRDSARREKRLAHVRTVLADRLDEHLWSAGGLSERARALLDSGRPPYDVVESLLTAIVSGRSIVLESAGQRPAPSDEKRGAKSS